MICSVCYGMLRGHQGSEWRGTYDLIFNHHSDLESLVKSAKESCVICRSLLAEISELDHQNQDSEIETIPAVPLGFYNFFRKLFYLEWLAQKGPVKAVERSKLTSAYLSEIFKEGYPGIYRLDFKLHDKRRVGTFVLHRVDARADEVRQASLVKTSVTSTTGRFKEGFKIENEFYVTLSHCWGKAKNFMKKASRSTLFQSRFRTL
ncbi:hypothetical protein M7I_6029 [Glarea lozoyensis 74030]|uniref:Uncharacterized protein n=1 Tax=Glarea lozoyensis (strain ATCC 74030 / MF5533) TaxID=1104152 RepID=H0ETG7_GLAL7|nr:hypothetical protein M7I_6029 [Glarea lozoyensis 74030]